MWSMAAWAADAADEKPRALMRAAPRCWTVGMNSPSSHAWSLPTASNAGLPPTSAWNTSGYWVAEWLPQTVILVTSATAAPALAASCALARLWSSRVMAVDPSRGPPGGLFLGVRALGVARGAP